ncbi:virulence-associated E family protein [Bradyrhizobium sp. MOS001]|nr:virulence-associated E family protein [Bradyrhizobium sp. MOS001]
MEPSSRPSRNATSWLSKCIVDEKGRIIPNVANVALVMRNAPELVGLLRYDEMMQATYVCRPIPIYDGPMSNDPHWKRHPLSDVDLTAIQEWLQFSGMRRVGRDTVYDAAQRVARKLAFHPVRDYLNQLIWDGRDRLSSWLSYYCGAEQSDYAAQVGRLFMISMVARIFQPGCKSDYMLILEGQQGISKSTVCKILGGEWFSDCLPDVANGGKDLLMHLSGKWLIEIGELSAMSKADSNKLKEFITRESEVYRRPYDRLETEQKRQCVFIGTTNKSTYLRDETGARRFWPVTTTSIDTDALKADRDQLFAQATAEYHRDKKWWPDSDFERERIAPRQEARYDADVWEDLIVSHCKTIGKAMIWEIARDALRLDVAKITRADQNRIAAILERIGWVRLSKDSKGNRYWAPDSTAALKRSGPDSY